MVLMLNGEHVIQIDTLIIFILLSGLSFQLRASKIFQHARTRLSTEQKDMETLEGDSLKEKRRGFLRLGAPKEY